MLTELRLGGFSEVRRCEGVRHGHMGLLQARLPAGSTMVTRQ